MAISFVQGTGVQSASAASMTCAYGANVTAGNLLLVGGVTATQDQPVSGFTDTMGNQWTRDGHVQRSTNERVTVFRAVARATGPTTVKLVPAAADFISLCVAEFFAPLGWDVNPVLVGYTSSTATNGTAVATGNLAVVGRPAVIFGLTSNGGGGTVTITPAGGWTQIYENENTVNMPINAVYQMVNPGNSYNVQWTLGLASPWTCGAIAYREGVSKGSRPDYSRLPSPKLRSVVLP